MSRLTWIKWDRTALLTVAVGTVFIIIEVAIGVLT